MDIAHVRKNGDTKNLYCENLEEAIEWINKEFYTDKETVYDVYTDKDKKKECRTINKLKSYITKSYSQDNGCIMIYSEDKEEKDYIKYIYKTIRLSYYWLPKHEELFEQYWPSFREEQKEVLISKSEKKLIEFQKKHINNLKVFNEEHNIFGHEDYVGQN